MSPTSAPPPPAMEPLSEAQLHALVDGRLSETERQALQTRLAADPGGAATVAAWQRQREQLRTLHAGLLETAPPPDIGHASRRVAQARQQVNHWQHWGGMAAGVLLAFGVGWFGHGQWSAQQGAVLARQAPAREFAHQAALAHAVYQPEVRHPVEVAASEQAHLVQWLSKRLGRPLRIPDLTPQGYELVGGRLLPGDEGARAQFMFQQASGARITLYLGAAPPDAPGQGDTAFRFHTDGPVPGFYWVDDGFGYALSGQVSRDQLLSLARAVHAQL